jgi:hypothetical protein
MKFSLNTLKGSNKLMSNKLMLPIMLLLILLFAGSVVLIAGAFTHGNTNSSSSVYQSDISNNASQIDSSYTAEQAISDGYVVLVSTTGTDSSVSKDEVYNIGKLDKFTDNINSGKKDKVGVISFINDNGRISIAKLDYIEFDAVTLTDTPYEISGSSYAAKAKVSLLKIVKTTSQIGIRYALLDETNSDDGMGKTLLSFSADSVK